MIQIEPHQVTPKLRSLFDPDYPTAPRCFAVLDGRVPGQILIDDLLNPTWGLVRQAGAGTTFIGGSPDSSTVGQVVTHLRKSEGDVFFGLWDGDSRLDLLPSHPDAVFASLRFTNRPLREGLGIYLSQVPEGCAVRRVDSEIFERCLWRDDIASEYGSADAFFRQGMGFCLMRGDEILSEAYADVPASGWMEIGTVTHEQYRGLGYSTIACAHVIQACEELGGETFWMCLKTNLASVAVARKLGYRTKEESRLAHYEAL